MRYWKNLRISRIFKIIVLCSAINAAVYGQWVNNPSLNTKIVVDALNPINISSAEDSKGGTFIFWEDSRYNFQSDNYFIHLDGNGIVSFRSDGKRISEAPGVKTNPVSAPNLPNTAVVIWKDFSLNQRGNIFAQRVLNNGTLLWGSRGLLITEEAGEVHDYAVTSDKNGSAFISYLFKGDKLDDEYELRLQKVSVNGKKIYKSKGVTVYSSELRLSMSSVIADDKGGAFIFWVENRNSKSIIFGRHVDSSGIDQWGEKPIMISNEGQSVISYSAEKTADGLIYTAWQLQKKDKDIYHQLLDRNGKALWQQGGKLAITSNGSQVNPQVLAGDSSIILCWTNEIGNERDVLIQKYNFKGKALWKEPGVEVTRFPGPQFGQKLITDGKDGAIITWIDGREKPMHANVYSQRINRNGKPAWDSLGIAIASSNNTEKSYLNIVSDLRGGAIVVFKDRREGKGEIYGQKIFNTGTYVSQIVGFSTELTGDSVKISWYSANEAKETNYDIEVTMQSDTGSTGWKLVDNLVSAGESSAKYYEYYHKPEETGTVYYRIIQKDNLGNQQPSDVSKLNYFGSNKGTAVAQNSPNPFTQSTVISFFLTKSSNVKIEFFNSHVEKVKEINKEFNAGQNEVSFSADGLKPGVYFYRFQTDDFIDVKKMVITKR